MNEGNRPLASEVGLLDVARDGWFKGKAGELVKGVRIRSHHTVIDVGCGEGGVIGFCAGQGAEVLFIDRDGERLSSTEEKVRKSPARAYKAILSDCNPIPLEDSVGDLVICMEVLEHVPDPVKFLAELIRVAKPGAQLFITVPDSRGEQLVAATAPPYYFQEPNHIRIFSADDFQNLILGAGLEIEIRQYLSSFWSMYLTLSWLTVPPGDDTPIDNPHPITDHWVRLWKELLAHPQGEQARLALNQLLPRTQLIVARKPR